MIRVGCQYYRKFYWQKKVEKLRLTFLSRKVEFQIRKEMWMSILADIIIYFVGILKMRVDKFKLSIFSHKLKKK